jgi:hypothetical protein
VEYGKWQLDDLQEIVLDQLEAQRADEIYWHPDLIKPKSVDLYQAQGFGLYFPPRDRVFYAHTIDARNDGKPEEASVCVPADSDFDFKFVDGASKGRINDIIADGVERNPEWHGIRQRFIYLRKISKPPKGCFSLSDGDWYSLLFGTLTDDLSLVWPGWRNTNPGVFYMKVFLKIDFEREVVNVAKFNGLQGKQNKDFFRQLNKKMFFLTALAVSAEADSKNLWHVRAFERDGGFLTGNIRFGVYGEHIKSLFFARDLPLTETGRKRPILHWVSAHKRRLQSGKDIDIDKYLRGSRILTIGGTEFIITKPCEKETLDANISAHLKQSGKWRRHDSGKTQRERGA